MHNILESESHIASLEEVKHDITIDDDIIKTLYDKIDDKTKRTNTPNKQWVACKKDEGSERKTTVDAIYKIIKEKFPRFTKYIADTEQIKKLVNETCEEYKNNDLTHKARIPFYISVLYKMK